MLASLQAAAFAGDRWQVNNWSTLLHQPGVCARIALPVAAQPDEAPPLGMLLTRVIVDYGEVLTIGVDPEARRRGVARALLADFLRVCRYDAIAEIALEVAMTNTAARALYAEFGFGQVARRPRYHTGIDGVATDAAVLVHDPR